MDVYLTIQMILCPKEVAKMLTRSYLDALTPGMRARLDPLSRIVGEGKTEHWVSITRNEPAAALPKYSLRPGRRPAGHVTEPQFPAAKK